MDLMDFDQTTLYFEAPISRETEQLIADAAASYGNIEAELLLLRANFMAPDQLMVLVSLYRYYFYQHRLEDALLVAQRALEVAGVRLGFPNDWRQLHSVGSGVMRSMGLVRFYLMVLKAAGYINLRLGRYDAGCDMLEKLVELDQCDRLGGRALLDVIRNEFVGECI
jgi:tetratricopeptide (TPR) repeat protein